MPADKTLSRPWYIVPQERKIHAKPCDPDDPFVDIMSPDGVVAENVFLSDAMLITNCVNPYEEVLAALKQVAELSEFEPVKPGLLAVVDQLLESLRPADAPPKT